MAKKKTDPEILRQQRENVEAIIKVHEDYIAKIPTLGFDEELEDRMIRAGEKYVAELKRELRDLA